jgi:uncharacterized protein (DUF1810 family)
MSPDDPFDLKRFVCAQALVFETVLEELRAGRHAMKKIADAIDR